MRVTLDDVNESPPAFTMSVYTASIVEQSGADTSVLDVSNLTKVHSHVTLQTQSHRFCPEPFPAFSFPSSLTHC